MPFDRCVHEASPVVSDQRHRSVNIFRNVDGLEGLTTGEESEYDKVYKASVNPMNQCTTSRQVEAILHGTTPNMKTFLLAIAALVAPLRLVGAHCKLISFPFRTEPNQSCGFRRHVS